MISIVIGDLLEGSLPRAKLRAIQSGWLHIARRWLTSGGKSARSGTREA
jgi:hypothetical protein